MLNGLSVSIPRGVMVGLLGSSGCGRTTLLRTIVGVQSGTVSVLGPETQSASLRYRVGYVTQDASVYDDLTVRQNLQYFRAVLDAPRRDVDRVLALTDLRSQAGQLVGSLSGGPRAG